MKKNKRKDTTKPTIRAYLHFRILVTSPKRSCKTTLPQHSRISPDNGRVMAGMRFRFLLPPGVAHHRDLARLRPYHAPHPTPSVTHQHYRALLAASTAHIAAAAGRRRIAQNTGEMYDFMSGYF